MRIFGMVKCGCRAAQPDDVTLATRPVHEAPSAGTSRYRSKRHRRVGPGKVSSGHWQPSLGDIMEDADQARKCGTTACNSAKPRVRREPRSTEEDYFRHIESSSTMSGYAPIAYLF